MKQSLWDRLADDARAEVDDLINSDRTIQAIVSMREHAGAPVPEIRECVDLLVERRSALPGTD
ncbi:hypothetical protein FCH28_30150 [Streptomyces piniterrae]|uniref:Uncharacterized protein n=1 Tax=Streptomyces piniterrae TaxID=2571125 RepID=A0A4U0MU93_9ACTN|nr:hypothetical protein [Streptomyces piniterrae]TJZ44591.1 hypothetical protein FCH28_30150 [Streptomyces piniterrae]